MVQPSDVVEHGGNSTDSILEGLMTRMAEVLTKNQTQIHTPGYESSAAPIGIKLDGTNYALWSQVLEMYISGKDKLGYINGDIQQPQSTDPTFQKCSCQGVADQLYGPTFDQQFHSLSNYKNEWWNELKAQKHREATSNEGSGRAALVNAEPQLSFISQEEPSYDSTTLNDHQGNCDYALLSSNQNDYNGWIIDSGATDHITFNPNDFIQITQPQRTSIANANGVTYPVTGAGTVALSPSLSLSNTLLVPSLSNKLMSVGQATEELNCVAPIYPTFCLLQDILTKEIIGRGTKTGGWYYMYDFSPENKEVVSEEKKVDPDIIQGAESETEPPHSSVPEDPSPENILEVRSPTTPSPINDLNTSSGYNLPYRQNCGKPPIR
ncbi:hypothetical protein RHGRI_002058 [Rhododendron griersonianum]|uniref:Retrotransposon Copia-like N-terminal domain-containing protein n=1 Tax=Rhododendron griersonianum TaxID=479676 RepID=A0AAV6LNE8_9ERIC|nr:hypothetical protein RHGRI_002058 [Rhododendron griersonianum]